MPGEVNSNLKIMILHTLPIIFNLYTPLNPGGRHEKWEEKGLPS
jgi:hypothetical protein